MKKVKSPQHYDSEGFGVVKMAVYNDSEFLSPYSVAKGGVINSEVAKFLDNSVSPIQPKTPLKIKIYSDCITPAEQFKYTNGIANYYKNKMSDTQVHLNKNLINSLILLILGIAFLGVRLILRSFSAPEMLVQVINIAGWVFIWEAVQEFVLRRQGIRAQKARENTFINAKIEFYPLKDMEN